MRSIRNASPASAALLHQWRRCHPGCFMPPYFPVEHVEVFHNVHRLLGVSRIMRIVDMVAPGLQDQTMQGMTFKAEMGRKDPTNDCLGAICDPPKSVFSRELEIIRTNLIGPRPNSSSEKTDLSSWLCTNTTRNMVVKIVYPGGRVEVHNRPILAAEVLMKNPRSCVTHPNVFRQPWAVVSPDSVLMLGQKFYVVPISTLRKLRRRSCRNPDSPHHGIPSPSLALPVGNDRTSWMDASRLLLANFKTCKRPFDCLRWSQEEPDVPLSRSTTRFMKVMGRKEHQLDHCCLKSLLRRTKPKPGQATVDDMTGSMVESIELRELNRIRDKENSKREMKDSSNRRMRNFSLGTPAHHWQPNLESITEE